MREGQGMTDTRHLEPSNFEGVSLEQMRTWVANGTADGLYSKSKGWQGEDKYLRDLKIRLEDKLKEVGVVMQSASGEALKNQAVPVALWTEVAADSALAQSELLNQQGDAFKKLQSSIPAKSEEQPVPDDSWLEETWDSFWTGSTDAEDAKAHNEKLRQEAVQAFQNYDSTSQNNVASNAIFTPPPESGMDVAVSGSKHPSVGGVPNPSGTSSQSATSVGTGGAGSATIPSGIGGGGIGGSGGTGGGGGGSHTTTPVWNRPETPPPTPRVPPRVPSGPGGPGYPGGPGVPTGPGGSGAGRGPGGGGAGAGRGGVGRGIGAGGRAGVGGPGIGAGGRAGAGGPGGGAARGAGGAAGAAGRGGAAAAGAAGARPQGRRGEEDQEHEIPEYLKGDQGIFDDDIPKVAPPVFGDWQQR
ncbi:hypothetical protein GCM10011581_49090 [Saccharopolyspora subtropica]|uniref:PPE family protein n=2 Tax=Saccharopolyspora thermophila TaxID=89367 RepID=A0A917KB98_9PSEU|nr:hypothetical protein GCM10011581_49090 [Saccharopolyspora subtropica]